MTMALPQSISTGLDQVSAQTLGWRAQWLRLHLTGPAAGGLTHRDRAALTLVATSVDGVSASQLVDALRRVGVDQRSACMRVNQLVEERWLERNGEVIDLPAADVQWIRERVVQA